VFGIVLPEKEMLQGDDSSITGCPIADKTKEIEGRFVESVRTDNGHWHNTGEMLQ
jgi:hypothetical protein